MTEFARALIVDDLPHARQYLRVILEAVGVSCIEAEDGEAVLRLAKEQVDLVITDLNMPGMNGYALIEQIQGGALGFPQPQIVVCSAQAGEAAVRDQVLGMGCAAVLPKPYRPVDVKEVLAGLTGER